MKPAYKRRKKLIRPGLQLRMSGIFVGLVLLMLGLQFALLTAELHHVANAMPSDGAILLKETNGLVLKVVLVSAAVFLPLTLLVGILSTFRVAGPLHRFSMFLADVRDGKGPDDFRLRSGDELHDIAELLNDATRAVRQAQAKVDAESAGADEKQAA